MKKYIAQLIILVPLLFIAGGAMAAYSFIGPTASPSGNNTDGPLDTTGVNQIKNGGLAVNAFQSVSGSEFAQQSSFAGLVNGGTANSTSGSYSNINFGTASVPVSISNAGNTSIVGNYQSNSLKSGGGLKPLCADSHGTFYICGASTVPTTTSPIHLDAEFLTNSNGTFVVASLTSPINKSLTAEISAQTVASGSGSLIMNYIKNTFAAYAVTSGTCNINYSTPTDIGTVTIPADSTISNNAISFPAACATTTVLTISSYTPTTDGSGRSIVTP